MHPTRPTLQPPVTNGINPVTSRRSTLAIRVPTLTPAGESLPGGHCYLMLPPTITLRDLIAEKVAAELRKFKVAGSKQSTLEDLVGPDCHLWHHSPQAENAATADALTAWYGGVFAVAINGHEIEDLNTVIRLSKETSIAFIVAAPVLA